MKIAIDIREAVREKKAGKGWYAYDLVREMLKQDKKNKYQLYTDQPLSEWSDFPNTTECCFRPASLFWHYGVLCDLKKTKPDIFFAPTSYIIPAFAPKNLKTIITVHDLVTWLSPDRHQKKATFIEHKTLPSALKKAGHIITPSESTKKDLQNIFKIHKEKITVIPCAASKIFYPVDKKNLDLPKKFILAVGTLEPRKNYVTLLRSFALLRKKITEMHLIIIGNKGWHYSEIFKEVEALQLKNVVHFPDYVSGENLAQYYSRAQMLVYPSLYEGFGMPPLEAMQCGCPVITSNNSSLPEVVGSAALLIDRQNIHDITEKMSEILSKPQLREDLIKRGIEQAGKFSWEKSATALIALFEKI